MRLAIFDNLPEGGAKRVCFEHVRQLSFKHDVYYYTNRYVSQFPFESYVKRVNRYDLDLKEHHGVFRPLQEVSLVTHLYGELKHIATDIKEHKIDCLIAHPSMITQGSLLLSLVDIPSIYMSQEWFREMYEPELFPAPPAGIGGWYERARKYLLKEADWVATRSARKIVTSSQYNATHIKQAYKRQSIVAPLGVDLKQFRPASQTQRRHFLFVGQKHDINGYDLLVAALEKVNWPINLQYIEFKDGSFQLSDSEMTQMYQRAVATLCLAKGEPFGLASLESQACGSPVIAVNEAGYQETVVHEETGLLIDRDPKQLISAIKLLATNNEFRETLGKNARRHVQKNFTWEKHIQAIEDVVTSIVS